MFKNYYLPLNLSLIFDIIFTHKNIFIQINNKYNNKEYNQQQFFIFLFFSLINPMESKEKAFESSGPLA